MVLVNGIDLNDGNMDMGKMKSVLDADVENIRNAKATVEKMIEEKMLGTEADGTIGVRLADGQINYHDKKGQEYIARNTALEFLKETEQVFLFSIVKMELQLLNKKYLIIFLNYLENMVQMFGLKEMLKIYYQKDIQMNIHQMVSSVKKQILWMFGLTQDQVIQAL